jgi:hypothetical protein
LRDIREAKICTSQVIRAKMRLAGSFGLLVAAACVALIQGGLAQETPVGDGLGECFKASNNFPLMFCDRVVCNGAGSEHPRLPAAARFAPLRAAARSRAACGPGGRAGPRSIASSHDHAVLPKRCVAERVCPRRR